MIYTKTTLSYYIDFLCKDYSKKTAITWKTKYRTEKISYKELLIYSKKFATFLLKRKLIKNAKVFIIGLNCPQWIISFFGTLLCGMILIPADYNCNEEFISKIISESNPSLYVVSKALEKKLPENLDNKNILYMEDIISIIDNLNENDLDKYDYYISDNDIAEIIFTSGTTDQPKGVPLTHRNIGTNIHNCSHRIDINSGTKLLSILPLSHMFEQIAGLFTPMRQGANITYIDSIKPINIKRTLFSEKINNMIVVPAFLETFKNLIYLNASKQNKTNELNKMLKISSKLNIFFRRILFKKILKILGGKLKYVISGGSKLNIKTEMFWNNLGIKVLQGYGLTETSPVITCTTYTDNKPGSAGKVLRNQQIKIADDGEIFTSGENVFKGYLNNLNQSHFENGWFKTGDIGKIDKDGYLYITGRKKNIIVNPAGLNIYPEDIESKLLEIDSVNDAVVLSNNDSKFILNAYIITEKEINNEELNKMLHNINNRLLNHQKLKEIHIWPLKDFPRTPTKKIIRNEIEKIDKKSNLNLNLNSWKKLSQNSDLDKIISILKDIIDEPDLLISEKTDIINDLGMDSINKLELITKLEADFLIEIPEEKFIQVKTVKDILNLIIEVKDTDKKANDNKTQLNFNFIYKYIQKIIFLILNSFFFLIYRVKVINKDNIYKKNNYIIVANHSSHLDFLTILRMLPSGIRNKSYVAAAHDHFFKKKTNFILTFLFNIFPFYRNEMMKTNLMNIGKILDNKGNLIIFPEGTRSRDGKIQEFKEGIGQILKIMNTPCLPVKLENTYNLLPYNKIIPKQGTAIVKIGEPIRFKSDDSNKFIADKLNKIIKEL